jgi:hypothetical protein
MGERAGLLPNPGEREAILHAKRSTWTWSSVSTDVLTGRVTKVSGWTTFVKFACTYCNKVLLEQEEGKRWTLKQIEVHPDLLKARVSFENIPKPRPKPEEMWVRRPLSRDEEFRKPIKAIHAGERNIWYYGRRIRR